MEWLSILTGVITVASFIARLTPNETDNKWVANAQKIVDAIALSSKPTILKQTEGE